jgi:hypothetical protein
MFDRIWYTSKEFHDIMNALGAARGACDVLGEAAFNNEGLFFSMMARNLNNLHNLLLSGHRIKEESTHEGDHT